MILKEIIIEMKVTIYGLYSVNCSTVGKFLTKTGGIGYLVLKDKRNPRTKDLKKKKKIQARF